MYVAVLLAISESTSYQKSQLKDVLGKFLEERVNASLQDLEVLHLGWARSRRAGCLDGVVSAGCDKIFLLNLHFGRMQLG